MSIYPHEAFVYCWTNITKGFKYIGYHKGTPDDGYICSSYSDRFWSDWKTDQWSREILYVGSTEECVNLEFKLLSEIDLSTNEWYNNCAGGGIVMTPEIRHKISNSNKGKKRPNSKLPKLPYNANTKIHKITDPNGVVFYTFNTKQYCKDNNLSFGNLSTYGHSKGFLCERIGKYYEIVKNKTVIF